MNMPNNQYSINTVSGQESADFQLYVAGNFETAYHYEKNPDSVVIMAERLNDVQVTPENLTLNIYDLKKWIVNILNDLKPPQQKRGKFKEDITKHQNKLDGLFKINGTDIVSELEYNDNTKIITALARPERILSFVCFMSWVNFLEEFIDEVNKF